MKKLGLLLVFIASFFAFNLTKVSAENEVDIYFFNSDECGHCAKEKIFLDYLSERYDNLRIHSFEVSKDKHNQKIVRSIGELADINVSSVPLTIIGEYYYIGYGESTGKLIQDRIEYYFSNDFEDPTADFFNGSMKKFTLKPDEGTALPTIGGIELENFSLPIIAIILGILDGFNPCAMWVLLFLISMLLGMKDRRKMWILGITFLTTSAVIYMFFMLAWLSFTSVIGSVIWLRMLIGAIALIGGYINLKSYIKTRKEEDGCDIVDEKKRKKIFGDIKHITHEKSFILALAGIIVLAISVNVIELACSAGLPVVFTGILVVNDLSSFQYIMYVLLYILFFLIDDIIIFSIAMLTFKVTGISTKYGKMSHLIGGIAMLLIGILMLLKPEWLMFNF